MGTIFKENKRNRIKSYHVKVVAFSFHWEAVNQVDRTNKLDGASADLNIHFVFPI